MPQPIRQYKDLNLDFGVHPNTKDLVYLKGDSAVKRSVRNIVLTSYYERHFDEMFGCAVKESLFDNISPMTMVNIQNSIETALTTYEPRIFLLDVQVDPDIDNNGYSVRIVFRVVNQINPIVIELFLEKVR